MMDIKDKIAKLLALSQSPNEHEAQLALLKARELMARHKLTARDVSPGEARVVHRETDATYSRRRAPWTIQLANVIAQNYCCRAFSRRLARRQTRTVCLAGFPGDLELCEKVFCYALSCIRSWIREAERKHRPLYSASEFNVLADSYARGYIAGLYAAYRRQDRGRRQEWALAVAVPLAVEESVAAFRLEPAQDAGTVMRPAFRMGYGDGLRFSIAGKLEEGQS